MIKVKDIDELMALLTKIKTLEAYIDQSKYSFGGYQNAIQFDRDSTEPGNSDMHRVIKLGLREYRKALIKSLKNYDVEMEELNDLK